MIDFYLKEHWGKSFLVVSDDHGKTERTIDKRAFEALTSLPVDVLQGAKKVSIEVSQSDEGKFQFDVSDGETDLWVGSDDGKSKRLSGISFVEAEKAFPYEVRCAPFNVVSVELGASK